MRLGGAGGFAPRFPLAIVAVLLSVAGCRDCTPTDVESVVAQWRSSLDTGLPLGSTVAASQGFFLAHGLHAAYSPATQWMGVRVPVAPADSRSYCNLVTSTLAIDCRFSEAGRLRACTVQAEHTGL
jgi:hypothetical protein